MCSSSFVLPSLTHAHTHARLQNAALSQDTELGDNMVPLDVAPLGILTLEDVIEELINEEIVDETDRYIDVAHEALCCL